MQLRAALLASSAAMRRAPPLLQVGARATRCARWKELASAPEYAA